MGKADLHLHTHYSDGHDEPSQLVAKAVRYGLGVISITDHDTQRALPPAVDACRESGVDLLPGAEMTTLFEALEVHLLVYGLDPHRTDVKALMHSQRQARTFRVEQILDKLRRSGVEVTLDEVKAEAGLGNLGRPHIAKAMVRGRWVATIQEAFNRHLHNDLIGSIEKRYLSLAEMITQVHDLGGVSVLAHPASLYTDAQIEAMVDLHLDGVEVNHPSHPFELQKKYRELAGRRHLLMTGGSDYHGHPSEEIPTGRDTTGTDRYEPYLGTVTIATELVDSLRRLISQRSGVVSLTAQA